MINTKVALITGITGQDGAFLAELLLGKGYIVHGVKRRSSSFNSERIDHLYQDRHGEDVRFFLHYGDLTDTSNLIRIIQECQPTEIYNLAAQSHVQVSFETPEYTANADGIGAPPAARGHPYFETRRSHAVLSGLDVGALRPGSGGSATGNYAVLSSVSLRRGETLRLLDHRELSGGVWIARLERNSVQS